MGMFNICWMCLNGINQGEEACADCGRPGKPLEPWMTWYFGAVLLAATAVAWITPRVTSLHPTTVEHAVLIGVFPFLGFLLWKLR